MGETLKFTLQSVLEFRSNERQQQRAELAALVHQETFLQANEQQIRVELADCKNNIRAMSQQVPLDMAALRDLEQRRDQLSQRRHEVRQMLNEVIARIEQQRLVLTESNRQVRLLEKLRQRREDEANRERTRREARNV